jgi:hypothetical protein
MFLPPYATFLADAFGEARVQAALAAMRPASEVMTKDSLKLAKASPFSFTRSLIDRMFDEQWKVERVHCEIDRVGAGLVVYRIEASGRTLTFVTRCVGLTDDERVGRIRDAAMDFYSALFDGSPAIERIVAETDEQVSKVWKGRSDNAILGWTFANRGNRLFNYVVDSLVAGTQPDLRRLSDGGGYLIRNAGFYGNGRHGSRSWVSLPKDHPVSYPYHVDLICLYLWRLVGFDFAEAVAKARGAGQAALSAEMKRYIGVGNSSGVGMVAALVRWPHWVSGFSFAREFALAMALTEPGPAPKAQLDRLDRLMDRAAHYYLENAADIDPSVEDRALISSEMLLARGVVERWQADPSVPKGSLKDLIEELKRRVGPAAYEQIVALVIETRPDLVGPIRHAIPAAMASRRDVVPEMLLSDLKAILEDAYSWALDIDFTRPGAAHYFWYRSEENGENRRGERAVDPGVEFETFVNVAGHMQELHARVSRCPADWTVARYLVDYPEDVYFVSRAQLVADHPYGECQSNLIDESFRPSDLIQYYLTVLGMETTNPGNFRWVRGVFMQGAPLPQDIEAMSRRDWVLPTLPTGDTPARPHNVRVGGLS